MGQIKQLESNALDNGILRFKKILKHGHISILTVIHSVF
jgi:hypothetical protein